MKVQTAVVDEIERIGVGVDQAFTINFDAKMARILADGLYSDKVQSVIRELSCNAWDSHVMAGKASTPFRVHFPTTLEPWFAVQDFGTGLSHDQVLDIYTRYGASTKTNSNEVIGQLGLGSKSPFALTSAFTVITRKDGVENHYSMYRNEQGMPTVAQLGQNLTNEPNGVTVQVPVRAEQRREFMDKAREVYKWFPVKPAVDGEFNLDIPNMEWAYQGTGWRIRKSAKRGWGYHDRQRPVALMGMVAYPLDASIFQNLGAARRAMLNLGAVLEFNIGDLEVAANREALGYDDRTIANITAKLDLMIDELGAQFEQRISSAPTEYEARKIFGETFSHNNEFNYEFREAFGQRGLHWNNVLIKDDHFRILITDLYPLDKDLRTTDNVYFCHEGAKRPRRVAHGPSDHMRIRAESKTVIFLNDLEKGGLARVHEFNKQAAYSKNCYVFGQHPKLSAKKLSRIWGGAEVVLTSSLSKPERAKPEKRTHILEWRGNDEGKAKSWQQVEIDLNAGGYYVELDGWDVVTPKGTTSFLYNAVRNMKEAGLIPQDAKIYAMRSKLKEQVRKDANWRELFSTARAELETQVRTKNLGQLVADSNEYTNLVQSVHWEPWQHHHAYKLDNSPMKAFCEHVNEIRHELSQNKVNDALKRLAQEYDLDLSSARPRHQLTYEYREIRERYPMLSFVGGRWDKITDEQSVKAFQYVDFVDICEPFYRIEQSE
jgi:hypothetical protein